MAKPLTEIAVTGPRDSFGRTGFFLIRHIENAPLYRRNENGTMIEIGRGPGVRGQIYRTNLWQTIRCERKTVRRVTFKRS